MGQARAFSIATFVDYQLLTSSDEHTVLLRVGDLYMQYNRRKGFNVNTGEKYDQLVIVEDTHGETDLVAGLDMDFKGNPFGPMPALMATAEYVTKVHAVCTKTGNLAHYSHRKVKNDDVVFLGETEEYEPLSRAAYYKIMLQEKIQQLEVNDPEEVSPKEK